MPGSGLVLALSTSPLTLIPWPDGAAAAADDDGHGQVDDDASTLTLNEYFDLLARVALDCDVPSVLFMGPDGNASYALPSPEVYNLCPMHQLLHPAPVPYAPALARTWLTVTCVT